MARKAAQPVNEEPMVKIGVVARHLGISIRTIHMYEREGLFISFKNPAGTRYFNHQDVEWLEEVRHMIKAGISIAGIRRLMSLIPCWEAKDCVHVAKGTCPVLTDGTQPCWANRNNKCSQGPQFCRQCEVYGLRFMVTSLKNSMQISLRDKQGLLNGRVANATAA
ncbi:MAG: MerR family transcriptional regulator [Magnetococcales bacterium]|nr:MerR family transcriptional regulator [Magnetococcales bacterium]